MIKIGDNWILTWNEEFRKEPLLDTHKYSTVLWLHPTSTDDYNTYIVIGLNTVESLIKLATPHLKRSESAKLCCYIFEGDENQINHSDFITVFIEDIKQAWFRASNIWTKQEINIKTHINDKFLIEVEKYGRVDDVDMSWCLWADADILQTTDNDFIDVEKTSIKIHSFYEGNASSYNREKPFFNIENYTPQNPDNWELYIIFEVKLPCFPETILLGRTYTTLNNLLEKKGEYFIPKGLGYSFASAKFSLLLTYNFDVIMEHSDEVFKYGVVETAFISNVVSRLKVYFDVIAPADF